jgi:RNA polymerase sigma-70 factor (ECF subfamily)
VELSQESQLVMRALDTLDLQRRAVFVMSELGGHTMPEIAETLSVPLNTAYSRLRLARQDFESAVRRLQPARRAP